MARGNFPNCIPVTFGYEGGLSMTRSDPGNWTGGRVGAGELRGTNFGIAASSHPGLDIRGLTKPEAEAIYEREYWGPAGCEALPAGLDLSHLDGTVNSGRGRSSKWLAKAATGTVTDRIHAYNTARLSFDQALRSWRTFGKAWGARCASVEAISLRLALGGGAAATAVLVTKARAHAKAAGVKTAGAHAGTATAAIVTTHAATSGHLLMTTGVGLLSIASAIALAFTGWRDRVRAAALTHEAANTRGA